MAKIIDLTPRLKSSQVSKQKTSYIDIMKADPNFDQRLACIRASMNKTNQLFEELKKMSEKFNDKV